MKQGTYKDVDGTHLQGEVITTRLTLEKLFGEPTYTDNSGGEKVTTEWVLILDSGKVATIYDWKRYEEGAPEMDETYKWHIGGLDYEVVEDIAEMVLNI